MFCRKTGPQIEIPLVLENGFPQIHHAIVGHGGAGKGADQIQKGLIGFRLGRSGECDEEAHARGINRCSSNLEGLREPRLPFGLQRIYRVTNTKGGGCGRCLKMCPFNKEGLLAHRLALWCAIKIPPLRGLLARMDDWFGYGKRNKVKKWWWDLEIVGKKVTVPAAVNERDLTRGARAPAEQRLGLYPAEVTPAADNKEPVPVDRKDGMRRYDEARRANAERKAAKNTGEKAGLK